MCSLLLSYGCDAGLVDKQGRSAMVWAIAAGQEVCLAILLKHHPHLTPDRYVRWSELCAFVRKAGGCTIGGTVILTKIFQNSYTSILMAPKKLK